jgi:hypothetical protein
LTIGGSVCTEPVALGSRSVTRAVAIWRPRALQVAPKRDPGASAGAARVSRLNVRVIQTSPSFFGKPWIHPRAIAKSWSTQMNAQVVTCWPSRSALTTR